MGGTSSPGGGGGGYELGISGSSSSSASSATGPTQFGNVNIGGASSNTSLWLIAAAALVAVAFILKRK